VPWFWSDQYDANIQILGMPASWPAPVVRGDLQGRAFSLFYLESNVIKAIVAVNAPRDLRAARRLVEQAVPVRPELLADPATNLQTLGR
jgi:3-phenylpropionate/trans-cinnamate dioxygenase ferredoxin reductase subunit